MMSDFLLPLGVKSKLFQPDTYGLAHCSETGLEVLWDPDRARVWQLGIALCEGRVWHCPKGEADRLGRPSVSGVPSTQDRSDLAKMALRDAIQMHPMPAVYYADLLIAIGGLLRALTEWPNGRSQPFAIETDDFTVFASLGMMDSEAHLVLTPDLETMRALYDATFTGGATVHLSRIDLHFASDATWRGAMTKAVCGMAVGLQLTNRDQGREVDLTPERSQVLPAIIKALMQAVEHGPKAAFTGHIRAHAIDL